MRAKRREGLLASISIYHRSLGRNNKKYYSLSCLNLERGGGLFSISSSIDLWIEIYRLLYVLKPQTGVFIGRRGTILYCYWILEFTLYIQMVLPRASRPLAVGY